MRPDSTSSSTTFPTVEDRLALISKRSSVGIAQMTHEDRLRHHSYDYAWRRVVLSEAKDQSPLDPEHMWFSDVMVRKAERMWRAMFGKLCERKL